MSKNYKTIFVRFINCALSVSVFSLYIYLLIPGAIKSFENVVDVLPPIAYHGGTVVVSFGFRRMLNSMVNARDS